MALVKNQSFDCGIFIKRRSYLKVTRDKITTAIRAANIEHYEIEELSDNVYKVLFNNVEDKIKFIAANANNGFFAIDPILFGNFRDRMASDFIPIIDKAAFLNKIKELFMRIKEKYHVNVNAILVSFFGNKWARIQVALDKELVEKFKNIMAAITNMGVELTPHSWIEASRFELSGVFMGIKFSSCSQFNEIVWGILKSLNVVQVTFNEGAPAICKFASIEDLRRAQLNNSLLERLKLLGFNAFFRGEGDKRSPRK